MNPKTKIIIGILFIGIVLLSGCVEDRGGAVTTTSISQDSITTLPAATTSTIPVTTTSTISDTTTSTLPATTTAPDPGPNPKYCERDSDCGWVSCCTYDYKCMNKKFLNCPIDMICLMYIEPMPSEPCVCINNRCVVDQVGEDKTEITITTDQTEYLQGEKILISTRNNGNQNVSIMNPFEYVEILENNEWKKVGPVGECPCRVSCKMPAFYILHPGTERNLTWDQKIGSCGRKLVMPGEYKISAEIRFPGGMERTIYSKEFVIKNIVLDYYDAAMYYINKGDYENFSDLIDEQDKLADEYYDIAFERYLIQDYTAARKNVTAAKNLYSCSLSLLLKTVLEGGEEEVIKNRYNSLISKCDKLLDEIFYETY